MTSFGAKSFNIPCQAFQLHMQFEHSPCILYIFLQFLSIFLLLNVPDHAMTSNVHDVPAVTDPPAKIKKLGPTKVLALQGMEGNAPSVAESLPHSTIDPLAHT